MQQQLKNQSSAQHLRLVAAIHNHLHYYPTPAGLFYVFGVGSLLGILLLVQVLTGVLLAMHYVPHVDEAFSSVERIMREVQFGWLLRYMHANGSSFIFILLYTHIARGIYFQSYRKPKQWVWVSGAVLFVLMAAIAFLGYTLPWGQMSFWGSTVITNLLTAIPLVGNKLVVWIWGGFAITQSTLNRFFSLHYILSIVALGLSGLHLMLLHMTGSSSPVANETELDYTKFFPLFVAKDIVTLLWFFVVFFVIVFYKPNMFGHPDNYIRADALVTPAHIVPEWYFLPFYAMLKAFPSKAAGAAAMLLSMLILGTLPWLDSASSGLGGLVNDPHYKNGFTLAFLGFIANMLSLGWLGGLAVSDVNQFWMQACTAFYFSYFLILLPFFSWKELSLLSFIVGAQRRPVVNTEPPFVYCAVAPAIRPADLPWVPPSLRELNLLPAIEMPSSPSEAEYFYKGLVARNVLKDAETVWYDNVAARYTAILMEYGEERAAQILHGAQAAALAPSGRPRQIQYMLTVVEQYLKQFGIKELGFAHVIIPACSFELTPTEESENDSRGPLAFMAPPTENLPAQYAMASGGVSSFERQVEHGVLLRLKLNDTVSAHELTDLREQLQHPIITPALLQSENPLHYVVLDEISESEVRLTDLVNAALFKEIVTSENSLNPNPVPYSDSAPIFDSDLSSDSDSDLSSDSDSDLSSDSDSESSSGSDLDLDFAWAAEEESGLELDSETSSDSESEWESESDSDWESDSDSDSDSDSSFDADPASFDGAEHYDYSDSDAVYFDSDEYKDAVKAFEAWNAETSPLASEEEAPRQDKQ